MRWHRKRTPSSEELEEQIAEHTREIERLRSLIFDEQVSADILIEKLYATPPKDRGEWVMDERTWHRARQLRGFDGSPMFTPTLRPDQPDHLLGLPVRIDPLASRITVQPRTRISCEN